MVVMKPIILSGDYGSGKSTLALLIAQAAGKPGVLVSNPMDINKAPFPVDCTPILDNCTIDNELARELEQYNGFLIVTTAEEIVPTSILIWTLDQLLTFIPQEQINEVMQ